MPNETVETAPSQPADAAPTAEAKNDAPKKSNLSVAQAAQRLLNIEAENAKAQRQAEQEAPARDQAQNDSANPDEATAESAEPSQQAETPEGEADVPSQDDSTEDAKTEKKIEKRIGKEIAKRRAAEAELAELRAQLAQKATAAEQPAQQVQSAQPLPSNVPLAQIEDFQSLQTLRDQAKEAKRFAQEQLDRDDFEPVLMGETVLDKKKLKEILRNAERTLDDDIPARAQFLTQKQEAQKIAHQMFPYLKSKDTPEYVLAQQALQQMPWMRNLPNADWIIGVQIEGLKALEAKQKAKPESKPKPAMSSKPPASQSVVSSAGGDVRTPSATKSANQIEALRMQLSKKGGVTANEAAAFLLAREKAKLNR